MGKDSKIGWLGQPLGPLVRLAESEVPVLTARNAIQFNDLIYNLEGDVLFEVEGDALKITNKNPDAKNIAFTIKDIPSYNFDMTLLVSTYADGMKGYPKNISRLMNVSVPKIEQGMNKFMSWINNEEFQSSFYFSNTPHLEGSPDIPVEIDFVFEIESTEAVWISKIVAYTHPDVMIREFENGVVLANPSPRPFKFNLKELFPMINFRRIKGSPKQDPVINDGSSVISESIIINGKDALFLIKNK
jgi:hypothetical protein